jgi:tyrosine-protein kinase Tec
MFLVYSYEVKTTAKTIPIRWTAPEALVHLEYHTASDVWSYGILMWEIFTGGKLPYAGFSNSQVCRSVA